ncbi:hypothetical protein SAMN04515648_0679 [Phyllobacterium sp. CL33Tsu]|uniref:hypothetical protein n=1 Tax=Phyllobacterium sp. CL33Tsu TaxID=1798191 RepID=UPI0008ECD57D|nr:hypothetical protein [Phyllobacterium sp. CL33Tsu]SFI59505.1 hypothetical protein SAMN04515648_0679 [Phyllobacterium sp. CL33Tsu]
MSNRENETKKRPRSLLSFAGQPEEPAGESGRSFRHESELERYHRMRALRLAAASDDLQRSWPETARSLTPEEAEQEAVDRLRAEMAAIKAELNRRGDEEARSVFPADSDTQPLPVEDLAQATQPSQPIGGAAEDRSLPEDVAPVAELPVDTDTAPEEKAHGIRPLRWLIVAVVIIGTLFSVDKGIILPVGVALGIALIIGMIEASQVRQSKASALSKRPVEPASLVAETDPVQPSDIAASRLDTAIKQVKDRTTR